MYRSVGGRVPRCMRFGSPAISVNFAESNVTPERFATSAAPSSASLQPSPLARVARYSARHAIPPIG
jgi:hypothetical protein